MFMNDWTKFTSIHFWTLSVTCYLPHLNTLVTQCLNLIFSWEIANINKYILFLEHVGLNINIRAIELKYGFHSDLFKSCLHNCWFKNNKIVQIHNKLNFTMRFINSMLFVDAYNFQWWFSFNYSMTFELKSKISNSTM